MENNFCAKACCECTLPRSDGSSRPKGWIQGNTKIGLVLEVTTSCLYGKHGIEIRIWSLSADIVGKHAWQQEEEQKEDSSSVLMIQEQLFISELFKDIQDAILLILHCKTML